MHGRVGDEATDKLATASAIMLAIGLLGVFVQSSSANFKPYPYPEITIESPLQNGTYNPPTVPLKVKVEMYRYDGQIVLEKLAWVNYSLDGQAEVAVMVDNEPRIESGGGYNGYTGIADAYLSGLSVGSHSLVIRGETSFTKYPLIPETNFTRTAHFTVDKIDSNAPDSVQEQAPKTIIVPGDYSTIQQAIDNSVEGDTVYVKKGVYVENPVVNKSISLVGEDRDSTVIDVTAGLKVTADGVTVKGFTIYDGWQGISVGANCCSILGNKITNATNGIVVFGYGNNITGNILRSIGLSSAIQLNFAYRNVVSKNYIESCVEGIQIWQGSNNNTIRENTITNCKDTAINFQYSNDNLIVGNNISSSGLGTSIYGSNRNTITKNNYLFNAVQFGANESYYLTWGGNPSINNINGNYWSDYSGADGDGDGIGNTPYTVNANHVDRYPLMKPAAGSELPGETSDVTVLPDGADNSGADGDGSFPILLVVAVATSVAAVVVAFGAAVYLKKRKRGLEHT